MKKIEMLVLTLFLATSVTAGGLPSPGSEGCTPEKAEAVALQAAGGAADPLTKEAHFRWGAGIYTATLSYSGVQFIYDLDIRARDCRVLKLELRPR